MRQGKCKNCDSSGWVCENHEHLPWDGSSARSDACGCGAGAPCPKCAHLHRDHPEQRRARADAGVRRAVGEEQG